MRIVGGDIRGWRWRGEGENFSYVDFWGGTNLRWHIRQAL